MCLKTNFLSFKRYARKDITCYKFLSSSFWHEGLETPYQNTKVNIGSTYESKLIKSNYEVEDGLHSFVSVEDARYKANCWGKYAVIVECIIPKGSRYYVGKFCEFKSYASDKLKYVKVIED